MSKITVYVKATGRQQDIPEAWLDHPVLSKPFRKTPPPSESGTRQDKAPKGEKE